jgi:hypothetical protein
VGDPVTFVQRYYALLPAHTDAAYALLGREREAKPEEPRDSPASTPACNQ